MPFLAAMALAYLHSEPEIAGAIDAQSDVEVQPAQEASVEFQPPHNRDDEPRLPPELLLELAPLLSARDLLELALASRSCHALLQAHLKWHTTKLPGALPSPEQAPLVRRLVYEAPASVEGDSPELRSFIDRASRLASLTWRGCGVPDGLWELLWRNCAQLHDVEVVDVSGELHSSVCKIFEAPYLTRLVYYTTSLPSTAITALPPSALDQSLARQQGLTELRLGSFSPSGGGGSVAYAGWLLSEASWPHLRILELAHHHAGDEEAVARFMDRHPGLEILSLPSVEDASGRAVYLDNIADDALPELRHFVGSAEAAVHILRGKRDKLRSIGGIGFDAMLFGLGIPQNWVATPQGRCILEGLSQASGLIELEGSFTLGVRPTDVRVLFANAPKLQRVKLDCRPSGSLDAWLPIFALIPSLTSLSFPLHMLSMPSRGPQAGSMTLRSSPSPPFIESLRQRVLKLSKVLPNLETVEFDGSGTTPVARVKRYAGTTEVEEVTLLRGEQPWIRSADANVWRSRVCVALS